MPDMPRVSFVGKAAHTRWHDQTIVAGALAWVVRNRLAWALDRGRVSDRRTVPPGWTTFEGALGSVCADLAGAFEAAGSGAPVEDTTAALRSACHRDPVPADPTVGALYFFPHWLEPPDALHLRATALIGPFVFFAPR